jgi:aryl-alcohol dehydrogenase-like predicted oxidoreductase
MNFYRVGKSWSISEIVHGCGALGLFDFGKNSITDLRNSIFASLDNGVNAFDTADIYGLGKSEELLSKFLGSKIKKVFVSTKGGINWKVDSGKRASTFVDCTAKYLQKAIDNSLLRLKLDSIPLYFVHWPDYKVPLYEILSLLKKNKDKGKIQYIGLSNFSLSQIEEANSIVKIDFIQNKYSLICREVEQDILPFCKKENINFWGYAPLAQGLLTGKYKKYTKFDNDDHRSKLPHFLGKDADINFKIIKFLSKIANDKKNHSSQIAIKWALKNLYVNSVVVGSKNVNQSILNAKSTDICIDDEYHLLNKIS